MGSQAVQDVYKTVLSVVAAFKGDAVRDDLHPVQVQAATGARGAAWEAQFVTQLARRVERAFTIADYYDKFNDET